MAKVRKEVVEAALISLVDRINQTMPNNTYKFLIGGAAGLLSIAGFDKIRTQIESMAGKDGLIETKSIKTVYEAAFKASGNKLQIELFNKPDSLMSLFVKPVTVTITKEDIDQIMNEVEQNAVVREVSLSSSLIKS